MRYNYRVLKYLNSIFEESRPTYVLGGPSKIFSQHLYACKFIDMYLLAF